MRQKEASPGHILVIGSGVGGLSAGIILSMLHYRVTVVEKNPLPGGLLRSYRLSGIDCPVGVHYLGALDQGQPLRRLWDYLGVTSLIRLERMGREGLIDRYIFDDFIFDLPEGIDAFSETLRKSFPLEHGPVDAIIHDLRDISHMLSRLEMVTSPELTVLAPESFTPMGQRLRQLGCSTRLTGVLSVPATLIGVPLHECPVLYYYMTLASYLMSSWRLAGGSGMADPFISRFRELGGEILAGDGVASLRVEGGHIQGAVLQSGRTLSAETVIAAIHPKTVVSLLPPEAVRPSYAARVSELADTKGLFGMNLALDAAAHPALPYNIYRLHPEMDGSLFRGTFHQLRDSGQPGTTLLSIMAPSGIEEWQPWADTATGRRGPGYAAAKEDKAGYLLEEAATLFGPFRDVKILDTYTPLTVRDRVNSPEGSPYGILRSTGQLMKAASLNRTAIRGLFLAGQNRLSPGVLGTILGSFQTVKQIIGHETFNRDVAGGFQ